MEIGGFALMLWFPIGTVAGFILVVIGWRQSHRLSCTSCEAPLAKAEAARCPHCHAVFVAE